MAKYKVKPGYCLHLPHGRFAHPWEEVELSGELEKKVLEKQGWKVELVTEPLIKEEKESEPAEAEALEKPPQDRAIKRAKDK